MMKYKQVLMVMIALCVMIFATGCGTTQVEPDALGLKYTSGMFEGRHFDGIVAPSSTKFEFNDKIVQIPINQRSFRIEQDESADINGRLVVPAGGSDAIRVAFELAVAFKLNTWSDAYTDPKTKKHFDGGIAQKFYEELCAHYECDLEDGQITDGWRLLLRDKLYPALQSAFKDEARRFKADDLVNNVPVETTDENGEKVTRPAQEVLLTAVGKRFLVALQKQTGGQYFCGPTFDRTAKGKARSCPPVELLISSVDFENPKVQESRENKKVAQDQVATSNTVKEALKDPAFLEYQKIQACRETKGTCVIGLSGVGVATVKP